MNSVLCHVSRTQFPRLYCIRFKDDPGSIFLHDVFFSFRRDAISGEEPPSSVNDSTTPPVDPATAAETMGLLIRVKEQDTATPVTDAKKPTLYALINYGDDYVQPLILSAMESLFPPETWKFLTPPEEEEKDAEISLAKLLPNDDKENAKVLQITSYETIDFEHATSVAPGKCLVNSYMIRKALIRKHYLTATVEQWVAKNPGSILKTHVKRSESFEVDYAEFLDDALVEAFDLRDSLERNEEREEGEREWWILKPGMSDRGQGIRVFSSMEELQGIFDGWEGELEEEDSEEEEEGEYDGDAVRTSDLRHFVVQPYIARPMLLEGMGGRKFHVRTYVLCVGSMRVYVYGDMLALFAGRRYEVPGAGDGEEVDLDAHLTNTCLQHERGAETNDSVKRFWDLVSLGLDKGVAEGVWKQICEITGDVFEAAARGMMVHFQPLENAFEVFGLDFLVDEEGTAWLLEVNAFPDFKQTGDLKGVVGGFWEETLRVAVRPFVGEDGTAEDGEKGVDGDGEDHGMVLVRDVDLGRRW